MTHTVCIPSPAQRIYQHSALPACQMTHTICIPSPAQCARQPNALPVCCAAQAPRVWHQRSEGCTSSHAPSSMSMLHLPMPAPPLGCPPVLTQPSSCFHPLVPQSASMSGGAALAYSGGSLISAASGAGTVRTSDDSDDELAAVDRCDLAALTEPSATALPGWVQHAWLSACMRDRARSAALTKACAGRAGAAPLGLCALVCVCACVRACVCMRLHTCGHV